MPASTIDIHSPLKLNCGVTIPNRLCKAAMTEGLADSYDHPTPELNRLYRRWSEGGAGLLISGNVMVDQRYLERAGNVVLEDDTALDKVRLWTEAGTRAGNQFWAQINHPGRQCSRLVNSQPLSPSDVQLKLAGNFAKPRPIRVDEIHDVIKRFATTARLAKLGGFSGVQVHSAHGYLGSQFLSPITNRRRDEWGGSLENRARFLLSVVEAVREAVGTDYPVSVKLNSADFQKGGFSLEDCLQVAAWLGEKNIDLLEISGGTYEHLAFLDIDETEVRDSTKKREAFFLEYAEAISQAAQVPLMITGGFRSLQAMNAALASGQTQMIGIARPFCVDPDFPSKMFTGVMQQTPINEHKLVLGKGFWGTNSASGTMRAINNQGQAGWYYQQIINLAKDRQPDFNLGVFSAFTRHMLNDARLALRRKSVR